MENEFILNLDDFALRCLINSPFRRLMRDESGKRFMDTGGHYISSWYKPDFEVKYFSYKYIGHDLDLVIVYSEERIKLEEMLDHILKNNGFALSKDNLFMLTEVPAFQDYLFFTLRKIHDKDPNSDAQFEIVAPAHKTNLIEYGDLFYPCFDFTKRNSGDQLAHYTRHRVDQGVNRFAYFKKK